MPVPHTVLVVNPCRSQHPPAALQWIFHTQAVLNPPYFLKLQDIRTRWTPAANKTHLYLVVRPYLILFFTDTNSYIKVYKQYTIPPHPHTSRSGDITSRSPLCNYAQISSSLVDMLTSNTSPNTLGHLQSSSPTTLCNFLHVRPCLAATLKPTIQSISIPIRIPSPIPHTESLLRPYWTKTVPHWHWVPSDI